MAAFLEWALVDGTPRRATDFVGVAATKRPEAKCLHCGDVVVWKAGAKVVPHVAHRPEAECASTNPETAEHINAKAHLGALLSTGTKVVFAGRCSQSHPARSHLSERERRVVESEYKVGTRRPDLVVFDDEGKVLVAVEVLHSHAVDTDKAAALANEKTRWVEVRSDVALAWDGIAPLALNNWCAYGQDRFDGGCRACEEVRKTAESEQARRAEGEAAQTAVNARRAYVARTEKNPPALRLAIAYVPSIDRQTAAVCVLEMRYRGRTDTRVVETRAGGVGYEGDLQALEFALEIIDAHYGGSAALIHSDGLMIAMIVHGTIAYPMSPHLDALRARLEGAGSLTLLSRSDLKGWALGRRRTSFLWWKRSQAAGAPRQVPLSGPT
ncbi:MAG: hypothetical protein JWM10_4105, partial [Myxococcaceae bacterium]|nr:hypothetical protein [Myxococcaceae bacterium]